MPVWRVCRDFFVYFDHRQRVTHIPCYAVALPEAQLLRALCTTPCALFPHFVTITFAECTPSAPGIASMYIPDARPLVDMLPCTLRPLHGNYASATRRPGRLWSCARLASGTKCTLLLSREPWHMRSLLEIPCGFRSRMITTKTGRDWRFSTMTLPVDAFSLQNTTVD
jgi:hypothetical protein